MACLPENMRKGVRYYVSLVRDPKTGKAPMIVGVYQGFDGEYGNHVFKSMDGVVMMVPMQNIAGCSAARS